MTNCFSQQHQTLTSFQTTICGLLLATCILGTTGCTPYEKVISRTGLLTGIEGAQSHVPSKKKTHSMPGFMRTPAEGIRITDDDGTITLYSKSMRQLMAQITATIQNDERDLFVEQVLSAQTKEEFHERGLDPGIAFDELVTRQRDIFRLFYFMPMGEYTPGMYLEGIGRNVFRLKVSRAANPSLHWIGMDAVFEDTNYRLRWFVP